MCLFLSRRRKARVAEPHASHSPSCAYPWTLFLWTTQEACSHYHLPMCAHYESIKDPKRLQRYFDVAPPADMGKTDVWPGYFSPFIRRPKEADSGDEAVPEREALLGSFGMIPTTPAPKLWLRNRASGTLGSWVGAASFRSIRFTSPTGARARR